MKIFLAGTYAETKDADAVMRSDYVLESFYYIKPWQYPLIQTSKMFLLDSGAFTFMSLQKTNSIDWKAYIKKYADFIKEYKVEYFFELDIDAIVGYEKVKEFRLILEDLTGKRCIPVWHMNRGKEEFIKHCEEYSYVALGGYVTAIKFNDPRQQAYVKAYPWFIQTAHERCTQIHGLGFTSVKLLPKYHFDSVDSTRWNCARFGRLEYFDGKTIKAIDKRKDGMRLVNRTSGKDAVRFSFQEWIKFQKYAETHL